MGWISKRHMRQGGALNGHPERQRKGPLRKIVAELAPSLGMFDAALVELECGHQVRAWGAQRARCDKCARQPVEPLTAPLGAIGDLWKDDPRDA